MKMRVMVVLVLALLGSPPWRADALLAQQRAKRAATKEQSPVSVTRSATLSILIASDSTTLFAYLSDSKKLQAWFPDQAILVPEVGGQYHFRWNGKEGVWSGVVTEFSRGRALGFTWRPPDEADQTNVRFSLSLERAETRVELTHSGFTSSESLDKAVKFWDLYLRNLKSVIEQGNDLREETPRTPARAPARRKK
jgi:uncharacterized protein YndB with AHSA1/START domain